MIGELKEGESQVAAVAEKPVHVALKFEIRACPFRLLD